MTDYDTAKSMEYELTYLAREIPVEIQGQVPEVMEDTYIPEDLTVHAHLRIRQKGKHYEVTKKLPVDEADGSVHVEYTIPLDGVEYLVLRSAAHRRVTKDRYTTTLDGYPAQVDVFKGLLRGLVLIDFEFPSKEAMAAFVRPSCCLADVTQEEFVAGGMLAGRAYEDIEPDLSRFHYVRLDI